jgi:HEAT repeat protein
VSRIRKPFGWVIVVCVAVLGLVWVAVSIGRVRAQFVEGRAVSAWVDDLCQGGDGAHERAAQVFKRSGRRAVPGLISVIVSRPSKLGHWLRGRSPPPHHLPAGVREWVELRPERQTLRRIWAIQMCALIGPEARDAHPTLMAALSDPHPGLRMSATLALAKTQVEPDIAVPLLVKMLGDAASGPRGQAAVALGWYGEAARSAVPALRKATQDGDDSVAFSARLGLAMIETPEKVEKLGEDNYHLLP